MIEKGENLLSTSRIWLLAIAFTLAVAVGLLAWRFAPAPWFQGTTSEVSIGHAIYAIDMTDDRQVAGFASDVFFGRVVENSGQIMLDEFPKTLFQVEVLEVLKGNLSGVVKVGQAAGVVEDGSMFFMAGDTQLLETGKVYLLVVNGPAPGSNGGGYSVVSGGNGLHEVEILEGTGEPPGPTGNTGSGEGSENGGDTNPGPNESPGGEGSTGNTGADEGPTGNTDAPEILNTPQSNELRTRFADAIANEIPFDFGD